MEMRDDMMGKQEAYLVEMIDNHHVVSFDLVRQIDSGPEGAKQCANSDALAQAT